MLEHQWLPYAILQCHSFNATCNAWNQDEISQGEISKDIRPGKVNGNMSCYCLQILDNTLWYRVVLTEECRWTLRAIFEALLQSAASLRPSRLPSTSNFLKPNQPFPFDRLLGRKFMEFNGRPSQLITDCVEISRSVDGLWQSHKEGTKAVISFHDG